MLALLTLALAITLTALGGSLTNALSISSVEDAGLDTSYELRA